MATTPVPAFIAPPDFPALSDRASGTYNNKAFAWAEAMQDTTGPNIHAIAVTAKDNADDAAVNAAAATAQANAAVAAAGAVPWVSGAAYAIGAGVYSLINLQSYRRRTAGAGVIDPSLDATNWTALGGVSLAQLHATALSF